MKLGLTIGYSGAGMRLPIERILRAEALGYDSVWTAESYGSDAVTPLAYIAALTKRIRLGTGVIQLAARTPANAAMCAGTVDALAGGNRFIVGWGTRGRKSSRAGTGSRGAAPTIGSAITSQSCARSFNARRPWLIREGKYPSEVLRVIAIAECGWSAG